jgi:hypothetical protein
MKVIRERFSITESDKAMLRLLLKEENEVRLSSWGQGLYATHGYEKATSMIREEVIQKQGRSPQTWMTLLHNAPLLLGIESSQLANYVAGSFAAFPEKQVSVGMACPNVKLSDLKGTIVSLLDLLQDCTIVVAGSMS